jgi:hypothetical protein
MKRVLVEVIAAVVLAVGGALLLWGGTFATNMVHDQLNDQNITFPAKGSTALDPKEFPGLQQYAGQKVTDGPRAKAYANQFIAKHLEGVNSGKTYSETSDQARTARGAATAAKTNNDPAFTQLDQTATALEGQTQTLFRGETLRGMLLYAWGWWVVGRIAIYMSIFVFVAAVALLVAAMVTRPRHVNATVTVPKDEMFTEARPMAHSGV